MTYIGRSISTGKYHRTNEPNITFCNHSGQSRSARNRPATADEISRAAETSFCKKCFPNGKPKSKGPGCGLCSQMGTVYGRPCPSCAKAEVVQ